MDEYRIIRRRFGSIEEELNRYGREYGRNGRVVVGKVYNAGAIPTALPGQFAVHPVVLSGTESEGGSYSATVDTSHTMIFTVVGGVVPVVNDLLIGHLIDGRWVADRFGPSGGTIILPGCPCSGGAAGWLPTVIQIHYNYAPGAYTGSWMSDTLTYQATPAQWIPLSLGANNHYGTNVFHAGDGTDWYYVLRCIAGLYSLWHITDNFGGIAGSYASGAMISWLAGFPGNRCKKSGQTLLFTNGSFPSGSYPANILTADETP